MLIMRAGIVVVSRHQAGRGRSEPSYVSSRCSLLVDNGATMVAVVACPRAVAVVGVSRGVAVVACPCRMVMTVVVVMVSCCRYHLFPVVIVLLPLWCYTEAHLE